MSMVRTALRLCTVAALRNRTWAGIKVVDSNNDPIDQTVITSPMPYIVVFTDDDIHECGGTFELGNSSRTLKLVIEFGMAHPIEKAEGGSPVSMPTATGENFEASLDNIEAQIERALGRDHQSLFGVLWNNFVTGMDVVGSLRAGSLEKTSVRWAARQKTYNLSVILDPVAGQPVTASHALRKFVAAARMWPDLVTNQAAVDLIETWITPDAVYPEWRIAQQTLGISGNAVRHIGIAPGALADDIEPAPLDTVSLKPGETPNVPPDDFYGSGE